MACQAWLDSIVLVWLDHRCQHPIAKQIKPGGKNAIADTDIGADEAKMKFDDTVVGSWNGRQGLDCKPFQYISVHQTVKRFGTSTTKIQFPARALAHLQFQMCKDCTAKPNHLSLGQGPLAARDAMVRQAKALAKECLKKTVVNWLTIPKI